MAYNYLKKNKGSRQGTGGTTQKQRVFVRQAPDETVHVAPAAMYFIGGTGILSGFAANGWQVVTTFTAFWMLFNPPGTPIDVQKQPAIFCICGLIAFSFQFALAMLTFRLDTTWKKHRIAGTSAVGNANNAQALKSTAIEMIQHVSLVMVWGALGFVADTIGDFTFIGAYTAHLDSTTQVFIIFMYAVALYALSTIAFVRSIEYLWAGFAAARNLREQGQTRKDEE